MESVGGLPAVAAAGDAATAAVRADAPPLCGGAESAELQATATAAMSARAPKASDGEFMEVAVKAQMAGGGSPVSGRRAIEVRHVQSEKANRIVR